MEKHAPGHELLSIAEVFLKEKVSKKNFRAPTERHRIRKSVC